MKRLVLLVVVGVGLLLTPLSYAGGPTDVPWPWGSECPFPWASIEGVWSLSDVEQRSVGSYLRIEVVSELEDGLRVVKVVQFNHKGAIVAIGRGVAPFGKRIVRAGMHFVQGAERSYWAIIRNYSKDKLANSCSKNKGMTVVTLRAMDGLSCQPDQHYVLNRLDKYAQIKQK